MTTEGFFEVSYRKLAWVGFESTTTKFSSDALTDWTIEPLVQLALRTSFVKPLQFNRLFSVTFHFGYCLRQPHHRLSLSPHIICIFNEGFHKFCSAGIETFWAQKIKQGKLSKLPKIFEIYQVFIYIFLSQNVLIPPILYFRQVLKAFLLLLTRFYTNLYK